jgi:hypothetical protein
MMPILHSPAVITPGQFGPISRDFEPDSERFTRTMSSTGMPSVMQTISGISASIASQIGRAAFAGRHAADHLGAVSDRRFRMERAVLAGEALADDLGVLVDQNGHGSRCFRETISEGVQ